MINITIFILMISYFITMESYKKYYLFLVFLSSTIIAEDEYIFSYNLNTGPNLISFPIITENNDIELFFTSENINLLSNSNINDNISFIIGEGEFSFSNNEDYWTGSLSYISESQGYWVVAEEPTNFIYVGNSLNQNLYFLHPGANLISYPFELAQSASNSLEFLPDNLIYAIVGQNEALLSINGFWYGSLNTFMPGKGYWFIVDDHTPFQYNHSINNYSSNSSIITNDYDEVPYNQSILQSIFFIESIYLSGIENTDEMLLELSCNNLVTGQKNWNSNFSDIIAMGNDGFGHTENYCNNNQEVSITTDNLENEFYFLKGDNHWNSNNFSINILSDCNFGDLNYSHSTNITDVIIMIEHIIDANNFSNNHQFLLADINQDTSINITDLIINIENILSN